MFDAGVASGQYPPARHGQADSLMNIPLNLIALIVAQVSLFWSRWLISVAKNLYGN